MIISNHNTSLLATDSLQTHTHKKKKPTSSAQAVEPYIIHASYDCTLCAMETSGCE